MRMTTWIRYRSDRGSWHALRTWTRVPNRARTMCGRNADGPTSETIPLDEKGCESCRGYVIRAAEITSAGVG